MAQISKYDSFLRFVEEVRTGNGHYPTYPAITAALGLSPRTIAKYFRLLRQESLLPPAKNKTVETPLTEKDIPAPPAPAPLFVEPPAAPSPLAPDFVVGLRQELRSLNRDNLRLEQLLAAANARGLEQEKTIAKLEAKLANQQERYNDLVTASKNEIMALFAAVVKKDGPTNR